MSALPSVLSGAFGMQGGRCSLIKRQLRRRAKAECKRREPIHRVRDDVRDDRVLEVGRRALEREERCAQTSSAAASLVCSILSSPSTAFWQYIARRLPIPLISVFGIGPARQMLGSMTGRRLSARSCCASACT
jgi:hypothetical protein